MFGESNVLELVKTAEDGRARETRDARNESETYAVTMVFKVGKDAFEQGAVALALLPLCRKEPFIVLIYQHYSLRVENVADVQ